MSKRGIKFLDQWLANNVPETTKADVVSTNLLTSCFPTPKRWGLSVRKSTKRSTASTAPCSSGLCITTPACPNSPCHRDLGEEDNPLVAATSLNGDRHAFQDPRRHPCRLRKRPRQLQPPDVLQIDQTRHKSTHRPHCKSAGRDRRPVFISSWLFRLCIWSAPALPKRTGVTGISYRVSPSR